MRWEGDEVVRIEAEQMSDQYARDNSIEVRDCREEGSVKIREETDEGFVYIEEATPFFKVLKYVDDEDARRELIEKMF